MLNVRACVLIFRGNLRVAVQESGRAAEESPDSDDSVKDKRPRFSDVDRLVSVGRSVGRVVYLSIHRSFCLSLYCGDQNLHKCLNIKH